MLVLAFLALHPTSCGGGKKNRLVRIEVTTETSTLAQGTSVQYKATGIYRRKGKRVDLTDRVTWSAVDGSVATVSNGPVPGSSVLTPKGTVSGLVAGSTTVTATLGKIAGNAPVTVTDASLVSIAIDPPLPSIANGTTQQFTATGHFSDATHQDLTASAVWSSSDQGVATISNNLGFQGLASAVAVGSTTITATFGGISGSTTLTVTAAILLSIEITPPDPSIASGTQEQFTATGVFSDGTTQDVTTSVTWFSSAESVATISNALESEGLASSSAVGVTTITANFAGISGSTTLTVKAATLLTIDVTPADSDIPSGTKQQFTATGTYTDSSTQEITSLVTWSSSSETVATISNASGSEGLASGSAVGVTTIRATSGSIAGQTRLTVTAATLVSIAVTPPDPSIANGTQQQFTATGTFSDDSTQDLTEEATWSSSETDVATISNASGSEGLATGSEVGVTTIQATLGQISGSTGLRVKAATLDTIEVTPSDPSIPNGREQQFTATGIYTDNSKQDLTESVTWSSGDDGVATISNASGSEGLASSKKVGSTLITASSGEISGVSLLTVNAGILLRIEVTPVNETIPLGTTQQFKATGRYSDNSTQDLTSTVTWSAFTDGVATISNASGSKGLAAGTAVGVTLIVATFNEIAGEATLTVTEATLVSIAVTPPDPSIANGTQQQFTATGTFSDDSTRNITTSVTWSSSDEDVATISNASGSDGRATGKEEGVTTIRATLGPVSGTTRLRVTEAVLVSIEVTPDDPTIANGTNQQFKATGVFSDDTKKDLTSSATWSSSDRDVATISNAGSSRGRATSKEVGSTTIRATLDGISGSTTLTVTEARLVSIAVTPDDESITEGAELQFKATGTYTDSSTQDLTSEATWDSSDGDVATISNASGSRGLATGIQEGTTTITAIFGAAPGSTTLRVTAATLESIEVRPSNTSIASGTKQEFTARGTYSDSSNRDLTSQATWSSSDEEVATISNAEGSEGLAHAFEVGKTTIKATLDGVSGSTSLTVTAGDLESIEVTPEDPSIPGGTKQEFKATGTFGGISAPQDITDQVTWSSSDTDVATISNADGSEGVATAKDVGETTIKAALEGKSGSTTLTVILGELLRIQVTPNNPKVPAGLTQQFTATGFFAGGVTRDITKQVTWSSSDTEYVTISDDGLAKAVAEGEIITITAKLGEVSGSTQMEVTGVILLRIEMEPTDLGLKVNTSFQMAATGVYSTDFTADVTGEAEWSSSNSSHVSVNNVEQKGRVTAGDQPGQTATITAKIGEVSASTQVTTIGNDF